MRDLTEGSIPRHLILLALPIAASLIFQTLYYLVDLYFVSTLGKTAVAGVSAAGNVQFIVMALTQVLNVGTMAVIAHAVGKKDQDDANRVFHQSMLLAVVCAALVLALGYGLLPAYMGKLGADEATRSAGIRYLYYCIPGLALQFAIVAMDSTLRGTGVVKPSMIVQILSVSLNAVLSPILITGWGTGRPLGVVGAGLATSLSVLFGAVLMGLYFTRLGRYVRFDRRLMRLDLKVWGRILRIGLPSGGEFALLFAYISTIYWVSRGFGAEAQAGFGIASRVMQSIFLPAMAVAFAVAPLAGQNVGAGHGGRVKAAFRWSALIGGTIMLALTLLCQWRPEVLIRGFSEDPAVIAVGDQFLRIISWNFVATGLIFTCSGMFQALGNTIPSMASSATRLLTFVPLAVWLSSRPGFELRQLWILSVITVGIQVLTSLMLLKGEFRRKLSAEALAAS